MRFSVKVNKKYIIGRAPWWSLFDNFFLTVQKNFVYGLKY